MSDTEKQILQKLIPNIEQEATKKTSLKLGLGENSKNNTNIELDKSKDIDLDPKR